MLDKNDSRRQRGNRPNGLEFSDKRTSTTERHRYGQRWPSTRFTRFAWPHSQGGTRDEMDRFFTRPGDDGFRSVEWDIRTPAIVGEGGKLVFGTNARSKFQGLEPDATNVVVQSIFAASSARPSASARCASSSAGWRTPSPRGA